MTKKNSERLVNTTIPAHIKAAGYADDGHFYLHCTFYDQQNKEECSAFVRYQNADEIYQHYQEINPRNPELAKEQAESFVKNNIDNRNLYQKLHDEAAESKGYGFDGVSEEDIISSSISNKTAMLQGLKLVGEAPASSLGDENDSKGIVYLATANNIALTGIFKDDEHLADIGSPAAYTDGHIDQTMIRVQFQPMSKKHDNQPSATFLAVKDTDDINFMQIASDPSRFNSMLKSHSEPFEKLATASRSGLLDMNINYKDQMGNDKQHRLTYYPNSMDGGKYFLMDSDDLENTKRAWDQEYDTNVNAFRAMQDPYTVSETPNKNILAKSDFLRVVLLAANEPSKFEDFRKKVSQNDPSAFDGVTKVNYLKLDDRASEEQHAVSDMIRSIANDPNNTFMNVVKHDQLKIPHELEKRMTSYLAKNYEAASNFESNDDGYVNAAFAVIQKSNYGKRNIVIPAYVSTEYITQGKEASDVMHQIHPVFPFVPHPNGSTDNTGKYRYDKNPISYFAESFAPRKYVQDTNRRLNLKPTSQYFTDVLDINIGNKQVDQQNNFTKKFYSIDRNVGLVDVQREVQSNSLAHNPTDAQKNLIAYQLSFSNNFQKHMGINPSPDAAIARHNEFSEVLGRVLANSEQSHNFNHHIKAALLGDDNDISPTHKAIKDMLLSDKLVSVPSADGQTERVNFSDLTEIAMRPKNVIRAPITSDINANQRNVKFEEFAPAKQRRLDDEMANIIGNMPIKSAEELADDLLNKVDSSSPRASATSSPRMG